MKQILLLFIFLSSIKVYSQTNQTGQLIKQIETTSDIDQKVRLLCDLSRIYSSNSLTNALTYADEAIKLAELLDNKSRLALAYNTKGVAYDYAGNYKKATEYYYQALKIWESTRDSTGLSSVYNNVGSIYNVQGNFDKASEFYNKSLNISLALKDSGSIAKSYNNLGSIYQQKGELNKALSFILKGLNLKKKTSDKTSIILSLNNVGYLYSDLGEWRKAITYHREALQMEDSNAITLNKAYSLYGLAQAYLFGKEPKRALNYALQNFEIVKAIDAKDEIKIAAELLNDIYLKLEDYKLAHQYLVLANQYKDSIYTAESDAKIAELQLKYASEKSDQENKLLKAESDIHKQTLQRKNSLQYFTVVLLLMALALSGVFFFGRQRLRKLNEVLIQKNKDVSDHSYALSQKQRELEEQTEELQKLNNVKDRLFSVIAHDLRGPLVSLKGLLHVLAKGAVPEEKLQGFFSTLETSQQNSLWLLDNLLYWAKAQMNGLQLNKEEVNICKITNQNLKLLLPQATQKGIELKCNLNHDLSVLADKEMIDIVIRNLVSNAIKFCKSGDTIEVFSEINSDTVTFRIKDTGIGILPEKLGTLFGSTTHSSRGTSNEKGSGLGLQLCKYFVEINNGKIWAESIAGEGSTFSFTLPLVVKQKLSLKKDKQEEVLSCEF
jgi:two-component system, sensor histidine kinase and response regulator